MNEFQWTVDAISIYGKTFELTPPLHDLPTIRHSQPDRLEKGYLAAVTKRANATRRGTTPFNAWVPPK